MNKSLFPGEGALEKGIMRAQGSQPAMSGRPLEMQQEQWRVSLECLGGQVGAGGTRPGLLGWQESQKTLQAC